MNGLQSLTSAVFDRGESLDMTDVEIADAVGEMLAGSDEATGRLVLAFGPLLRKCARPYAGVLGPDDIRTAAVLGLFEAAGAVENRRAFAGAVREYVVGALKEAAAEVSAVHVPSRTLTRYYGVLRRAGGDVDFARAIAPEFALSREAFDAIANAVACGSIDSPAVAEVPWGDDPLSAIESRDLVRAAFRATDEVESDVIRSAYGFSDYRPKGDAEIAGEVGMSRASVQRTRSRGLGKMREALAVDVEE